MVGILGGSGNEAVAAFCLFSLTRKALREAVSHFPAFGTEIVLPRFRTSAFRSNVGRKTLAADGKAYSVSQDGKNGQPKERRESDGQDGGHAKLALGKIMRHEKHLISEVYRAGKFVCKKVPLQLQFLGWVENANAPPIRRIGCLAFGEPAPNAEHCHCFADGIDVSRNGLLPGFQGRVSERL